MGQILPLFDHVIESSRVRKPDRIYLMMRGSARRELRLSRRPGHQLNRPRRWAYAPSVTVDLTLAELSAAPA